ncbi:hypothetical protein MACK_000887 [Theileria orientalis]|uniref:Hydrolase n=1 Tax=Theileria orientalis TaxID=68886 RepID=A0A976MAT2_THEOR|nr:hypothetical protein MACK_000887 [Theileria orientalis]
MQPISEFVKPDPLPKYFAIDVDGTFFTTNKEIFERNTKAFKLLKNNGITPFLCTARDPASNSQIIDSSFVKETDYQGYPGVYANGSLVYDCNGNLIKNELLSSHFLEKFNDYAQSKKITDKTIYLTDNGLFCLDQLSNKGRDYINRKTMCDPITTNFEDLKQKNVVSIITVEHPLDDFELINEVCYVKYNKGNVFQLSPRGCSKKMGIEALLKHFNSNGNECAYIGDNANDREAMQYCRLSFAVGNADDLTKRNAKWVLDLKYDEGGFEKAVYSLYCPS